MTPSPTNPRLAMPPPRRSLCNRLQQPSAAVAALSMVAVASGWGQRVRGGGRAVPAVGSAAAAGDGEEVAALAEQAELALDRPDGPQDGRALAARCSRRCHSRSVSLTADRVSRWWRPAGIGVYTAPLCRRDRFRSAPLGRRAAAATRGWRWR